MNLAVLRKLYSNTSKIRQKIKAQRNEDINLINQIEKIFIAKRGYSIKIPHKNTSCIILATGGLDSTISTFILLKFFHVQLYPLFINWGQKNLKKETQAFLYFVKYFRKKFPNLYHQPKFITSHIPASEIFNFRSNIVTLRNTTFANHAVSYSKYLEETKKIFIRTIFLNTTASDGDDCPDTTLTAIRATNLNICANENDYRWQIISWAIEKEFGFYLHKEDTINLAVKFHIPIEKTWSCYQGGKVQCGTCFTCWSRKIGFEKANIPDKTAYYQPSKFDHLKMKILGKINKVKQHLNVR